MDLVLKWRYSDRPKYSKKSNFLFDLSTLLAYNFLLFKASKMRLVSSERSFTKLPKGHAFQLVWFKTGGTVISQITVKNQILSSFDLSTL